LRRALLVRHGESEFSRRGVLNGDPSVPLGLTAHGREQARMLADELAGEELDLAVTTPFPRVVETADEALRGRDVPRVVVADLGDPRYGIFEGDTLEAYRAWARDAPSSAAPPGGGESRHEIVERYVRGFRAVVAQPGESILVVAHSLPIAYMLAARAGVPPQPRTPLAELARPYPFAAEELERATALLAGWAAAPTW